MPSPALICLDFDGTLILDRPGVAPEFLEILHDLTRQGAKWAVCTGRTLELTLHGVGESRIHPHPDFIIAREREIHLPTEQGQWTDHPHWNQRCHEDHRALFSDGEKFLREVKDFVRNETHAQFISLPGDPAGVIGRDEADIERIVQFIVSHGGRPESLSYERNSIYLRFSHRDYNKGSSIRELARHLGVDPRHIFVAGDNLNDLSMLNRETAHHLACPANALESIKNQVRLHGGHVATQPASHGIAEALRTFFY